MSTQPPADTPGLSLDERASSFLADWFATCEESPNLAPSPIKIDRMLAAVRRDALAAAAQRCEDAGRVDLAEAIRQIEDEPA